MLSNTADLKPNSEAFENIAIGEGPAFANMMRVGCFPMRLTFRACKRSASGSAMCCLIYWVMARSRVLLSAMISALFAKHQNRFDHGLWRPG